MSRLNLLHLVVDAGRNAGTITDHIGAFSRYSRHRIFRLQNYLPQIGSFGGRVESLPRSLPLHLFDGLIVHYSNYLAAGTHLDDESRERIRAFRGLKVIFIQDEYRTVDATISSLHELGFDILYTCVPDAEIPKVYPPSRIPRLKVISTLTGFVPESLTMVPVPPIATRPIDVGYRARPLPYWLGELGVEKWRIAPQFLEATAGTGLRCDLSYREEDRIYGKNWIRFVTSCKTMLGVESGSSVFDFSGRLQRDVDAYVSTHPGATFEEVRDLFFRDEEGRIRLNQISPRSFEAAALRTPMVMFEGEYSGILEPHRHFIPLRKDFANIDEVVRVLRDHSSLQALADRTFSEVACNPRWSYRRFIEEFDDELSVQIGALTIASSPARNTAGNGASGQLTGIGSPAGQPFYARAVIRSGFPAAAAMADWGERQRLRMAILRARLGAGFTEFLRASFISKVLIPIWVHMPPSLRRLMRPLIRRLINIG